VSRGRTLGLIVVGLVIAAGALVAWQRSQQKPVAQSPQPPAASTARALEFSAAEVIKLEPVALTRVVPITGTLTATIQTIVKSRVSGDVSEITVREGMSVKAGERVASIDPTDFQLRVSEREAALRSAQAQLEQARRTLANNQALLEKNFISQNAFDNARWSVDVASAARDSAQSLLDQAKKSLADTRITAPMSGLVSQRFVQPGEKVSPDNRILSIVDLSRLEVEAQVPAGEAGSLRIGQRVTMRIEGVPEAFGGRVLRINPATQAGTRAIAVYIGLDRGDERLRAGLFAQGSLILETREGVIAVPPAAVRDAAGRRFVYLIEGEVIAEREVRLGLLDDAARAPAGGLGLVEVVSGLAAGDRVIAINVGLLRPGAPARVGAR
jgi:RND family efflux transporter MFP subunit